MNHIFVLMNEFGIWDFPYPTYIEGVSIVQVLTDGGRLLTEGEFVHESQSGFSGSIWTRPEDIEHFYYSDQEGNIRKVKFYIEGA